VLLKEKKNADKAGNNNNSKRNNNKEINLKKQQAINKFEKKVNLSFTDADV